MRASKTIMAMATVLVMSAAASAQAAEELTVEQIVARANHVAYYQGANGRAHVKMTIVDEQKRERLREMTILRWDAPAPTSQPTSKPDAKGDEPKTDKVKAEGKGTEKKDSTFTGEQKFYVFFHKPADVSGMSFLVHKHLDRDDDRWIYLPGLDLVKRIAGSEKRTSFVGSDFFYEDVSGRNIADDKHELVSSSGNFYVLKNTPKDPKKVEFAHYITWIHKKTFLVIKNEYYKPNGQVYRKYQALAVKPIQNNMTVTKARMDDVLSKRHTIVEYSDVKYDTDLTEDIFSERYLRRPPMKHLEAK